MLNRVGVAVLGFGICVACARAPALRPAVPNPSLASLHSPFRAAFVPTSANPARKAKLLALVPQLDALFSKRLAEVGATGAAIGIVLEGEVVYQRGFGVRDVRSAVPVDEDTRFRIGSVSKPITALAILRLREQGKLVLDAPAASYLPILGSLVPRTLDSPPITVRHLLTMTSGLPYDDQWGAVSYGMSDAELEAYLARGITLAGAPGERYRYSNLGYALLGKIVAAVSGRSFEAYVTGEVFGSLGFTATGYVTDRELPPDDWATGFYREGGKFIREELYSDGAFAPAGGVYSTIRDLARFAAFQLSAYPPRDEPETGPVSRSTLREMHAGQAWARFSDDQPVVTRRSDGSTGLLAMSYGLGWSQVTTCFAEAMVQHGGYEPGYWAAIRLIPRQGIGVVSLSTTENLGQLRTFELAMALLQSGGVLEAPALAPSVELLAARENVLSLLQRWQPGRVAGAFDRQSLQFSFLRNLRPDFERMAGEHGACKADGDIVTMGPRQGRFRVACERGSIEFVAYLTPGTPALLQSVEYRQFLPVDEVERAAARGLTLALNGGPLPPELLSPGSELSGMQARLARLRGSYGNCELEGGSWSDGKGQASFRLRCADGPLELTLRFDPKTRLIADVSGAKPRTYGAVCAE